MELVENNMPIIQSASGKNSLIQNDKSSTEGQFFGRKVVAKRAGAVEAILLLLGLVAVIIGVSLLIAGYAANHENLLAAGVIVGIVGIAFTAAALQALLGCR